MTRIAIIGGTGEFGKLFARLFKENGHDVTITGRNVPKGEKAARELDVNYTSDNVKAARENDVVIISVYIENTAPVIEEVAPHVRDGCLLMDFTSVKIEPTSLMEKFASPGVEIIGTHPMFGPRVRSIEGLVFIITPVRVKKWDKFLHSFLEMNKARVITTSPEEHDRIMSVVQCLTHFTYISFASALGELHVDVKESRTFASPIYELMLDLIARVVGQSPQLYASIQMHNPLSSHVHRVFIDQAEWLKKLVENNDIEGFTKMMVEAARNLGDIDTAMGRSDKAILALTHELKRLANSMGKEVGLKHIYSGKVHVGIVKEVGPERVRLALPSGKEVELKVSNVELLDSAEIKDWKKNNRKKNQIDISVILDEKARENIIRKVVLDSSENIISCEILDVYQGRQILPGKKSITLRIEGIDVVYGMIKDLLLGIGGTIR